LAKIDTILGEHWNEKGIADFADLHIGRAGGIVPGNRINTNRATLDTLTRL